VADVSPHERKGQHTLTDDAIASDLRVFALAIAYLEGRSSE
jgi:hypothetical protein